MSQGLLDTPAAGLCVSNPFGNHWSLPHEVLDTSTVVLCLAMYAIYQPFGFISSSPHGSTREVEVIKEPGKRSVY